MRTEHNRVLSAAERKAAKMKRLTLARSFSKWLLFVFLAVFLITVAVTYIWQTRTSARNNERLLSLYLSDTIEGINDASDENLMLLTLSVAEDIKAAGTVSNELLSEISSREGYDFSEINVVDENGLIAYSTNPEFVGFDMASGEQSAAFLALLEDEEMLVQPYQPISKNGTYMKYAGCALPDGGFVQVGYDSDRFHWDIDYFVLGATKDRHVGETGYILIAGANGEIVSAPTLENLGSDLGVTGISLDTTVVPPKTRFVSNVYDTPCYCMYDITESYCVIAVEPVAEVMYSRSLAVGLTVLMEIFAFAALYVFANSLLKKLVVRNINKINDTLGDITGGNLNVTVDVRTNKEFNSLSNDINSTVDALKGLIEEAAARLDKELEIAKVIQLSSLPCTFPPYPNRTDFDIFATMDAAKEVGGDFYDFYLLDKNRLAFLIADVSGKGITAAMFMMKAKTLITGYAEKESEPAAILTKANAALCEGNEADMFVTCWMGILDFSTYKVSFANAGHNPPLVRRSGGTFEYFKSRPGFVLGGMEGTRYKPYELELLPGDEIFLYTDGVTEATNSNTELYGDERLKTFLNTLSNKTSKEFCRAVKADVDSFVGKAPQFDDITMLMLRLLPRSIITLTPCMESMAQATEMVEGVLERACVPMKTAAKINIAVDEVYSNIIQYSGADTSEIECTALDGRVVLVFTDNGSPYNPLEKQDPDVSLSAEDREIGGLGIFMVKNTMDSVDYEYHSGRNILTLTKHYEPLSGSGS